MLKRPSRSDGAPRQQLCNAIKKNIAPPVGAYTGVFHGNLPSVCRENQMISKARLLAKRHDRSKLQNMPSVKIVPWAYSGKERPVECMFDKCDELQETETNWPVQEI